MVLAQRIVLQAPENVLCRDAGDTKAERIAASEVIVPGRATDIEEIRREGSPMKVKSALRGREHADLRGSEIEQVWDVQVAHRAGCTWTRGERGRAPWVRRGKGWPTCSVSGHEAHGALTRLWRRIFQGHKGGSLRRKGSRRHQRKESAAATNLMRPYLRLHSGPNAKPRMPVILLLKGR